MSPTAWDQLQLRRDPILVVGLRPGTKIEGYRLTLDKNLHAALRAVAESALAQATARTRIDYTPYVEPSDDEYLSLNPQTLTITFSVAGRGRDAPPTQKQRTAALWETLQKADTLPTIGAKKLLARADELYFQAICYHGADSSIIAFVTKTNSRQVLKRSAIPLGLDNSKDRFKSIEKPAIVLEGDVHAIMESGEIAILNRTQFQFLVGDIGLVTQYAQKQVALIASALQSRGIPLTTATAKALEAKARDSIAVAKRLDAFYERVSVIDIKRVSSGIGFRDQRLKPKDFVNAKGELNCKSDRILELLDALEGRFFGDAFSDEQRRADRYRKRP